METLEVLYQTVMYPEQMPQYYQDTTKNHGHLGSFVFLRSKLNSVIYRSPALVSSNLFLFNYVVVLV